MQIPNIHKRIQELIAKKDWTLYRLSEETGIYKTTVYDWYNEKHLTPSRKSIELICAALNISLAEFYSGIDESKLDPEQTAFLELFSRIPKDKRPLIFEIMKTMGE